jgi:predicted ATPase
MSQGRLVTIVGPAGVGKTRLATELVRRAERPEGAWLVRLDSAREAVSVLQAVVEALGIAAGNEATVLDHLRGAHAVLALDNCEHVVDAVAALVSRLLDSAPWLEILCTSQLPLGLDGEAIYLLEPLAVEAMPVTGRVAARDRAGGGPRQDAVRGGDRPTAE